MQDNVIYLQPTVDRLTDEALETLVMTCVSEAAKAVGSDAVFAFFESFREEMHLAIAA